MKLPAVAMAAAFGCGVAVGLWPNLVPVVSSRIFLLSGLAITACVIAGGILLARLAQLWPSATAAIVSWTLLGAISAGIAQQPLPSDHVLALVDAGKIDLRTPLRWHGRLRDEPARLPWGYGYEIDLASVEYENASVPIRGGMQLNFTAHPNEAAPPDLHAGDEITIIAQGRQPQVFRDEGAFDRRAYLAAQGIDLVATLRAPQLIQRNAESKRTPRALLARLRRRLREETDSFFAARPQVAGVVRAMLLGDRTFVDRDEATDFQKTGVFHVLVVAGLHVGALAVFLFWMGRKFRLTLPWTTLLIMTVLLAYVAVVEERPPVLRAALMGATVLLAGLLYRRVDLLN